MNLSLTNYTNRDRFSDFWRGAYWCLVAVLAVFVAIDTNRAYLEFAIGKQYRSYQRILESGDEKLIASTFDLGAKEIREKSYLADANQLIIFKIDQKGWSGNASATDGVVFSFMSMCLTLLVGIIASKPILKKLRAV